MMHNMKKTLLKQFIKEEIVRFLKEPINESKKYTKGDELHVKLKSGKEFDIVFDSYSSTDGIAFGRIDGETKPFSLNAVVESVNEAKKFSPLEVLKYLGKQGYSASKIKFDRELGGAMSFKLDGEVIGRLNRKGELVDLK